MRPKPERNAKSKVLVTKKGGKLAVKSQKSSQVVLPDENGTTLSNGIGKGRSKNNVPTSTSSNSKDVPTNGKIEPKQQVTGKRSQKRKLPPLASDVTDKRSRVEVGETSKLTKEDAPSKATVRRQKVALDLPKLPTASGVLFLIGDNTVGQLGLGESVVERKRPFQLNFPSRFVDIAAGGMHSVCLTDKGEVYTFGCNDEGALGRPTEDEEGSEYVPKKTEVPGLVVKVTAGDSHSAALTEKGQVFIWGNFRCQEGFMGLTSQGVRQTTPIPILNGVKIINISSGSDHLVCLSNEGLVYSCGCGEVGQLGRVTERSSKGDGRKGYDCLLVPDAVNMGGKKVYLPIDRIWTGSYSTYLRVMESGAIYAFGLNNYNQLGFENELTRFFPKIVDSFKPDSSWQQISGGQHHTLALDAQGQVYSLGRKEYGRLGLGEDTEEKSVPTEITTLNSQKCVDISSGNVVSFSVTERGSVHSWGMGTNLQLGHGNDQDCHVPRLIEGELLNSWHVLKVSGGGQHTLVLANRKAVSEEKP